MEGKKKDGKKRGDNHHAHTNNKHGRGHDDHESSTNGAGSRKTRRGKDEELKRDFACGCGKTYLSYPALYTHIKQKHNGKCPEGSSIPTAHSGRTGRGRPPKVRQEQAQEKKNEPQENPIHKLLYFLSELETRYKADPEITNAAKQAGKSLEIVMKGEDGSGTYDPLLSFPSGWFTREEDYKPVFEQLEQLLKVPKLTPRHQHTPPAGGGQLLHHHQSIITPTGKDQLLDRGLEDTEQKNEGNLKLETPRHSGIPENLRMEGYGGSPMHHGFSHIGAVLNANRLFAMFIKEVTDYVKRDFYTELVYALLLYRRTLNEEGWGRLKAMKLVPENFVPQNVQEYCELCSGEYIPDMANEFVLNNLAKYVAEAPEKPLVWFGAGEEQLKNVAFIVNFFCNWLYANKFTSVQMTFDVEHSALEMNNNNTNTHSHNGLSSEGGDSDAGSEEGSEDDDEQE